MICGRHFSVITVASIWISIGQLIVFVCLFVCFCFCFLFYLFCFLFLFCFVLFCVCFLCAVWWSPWFDPDLAIVHWITMKTCRILYLYENVCHTGVLNLSIVFSSGRGWFFCTVQYYMMTFIDSRGGGGALVFPPGYHPRIMNFKTHVFLRYENVP